MSSQMTSKATHNAIFSRASAAGRTHSVSRCGMTLDLFGQDHVHASHSQVKASERGQNDDRHLWPELFRLISASRPGFVFGEQVEGAIGMGWLDGVHADLAREGYAFGFAILGAHSVGAPHIRQRIYWMGDAGGARLERQHRDGEVGGETPTCGPDSETGRTSDQSAGVDAVSMLRRVDMHDPRDARTRLRVPADRGVEQRSIRPWEQFDALPCEDGWRRVESGSFPLAHGVSGRVGRLRAYGNAIVPQVAAQFIQAVIDTKWEAA